MADHLIKICGIRDPDIAKQAAMLGANFIGIVFHPESPRNVSIDQAVTISAAAIKAGALPVAIFVNQTVGEMERICEATNIHVVQLHGETACEQHHLLSNKYQRIYVPNMTSEGEIQKDIGLKYLDSNRDMILIDNAEPGCGRAIKRRKLYYDLPFPWMLAGGLSPLNVVTAINDFQPNGVDVSSGVESSRGYKDIFLIQQFVSLVRGIQYAA